MNKYDKKLLVKFIKQVNKRLKKDRKILINQDALNFIKSKLFENENVYGETYYQLSCFETISGETIELDYPF